MGRNADDKDIQDTRLYIEKHNLNVFVHSIYLINLCKPYEEFSEKARPNIIWELQTGARAGFKGVVIHCGKSLKMNNISALNNMFTNMCSLIEHIDENCPLLLETSSGQGSETLYCYSQFVDFYNRFTQEQKNKIKICIDTCHVYGHDPLLFIMNWDKTFPNSLVLVHFNDSKEKCGEKKDRHMEPGTGHIGIKKMNRISLWCKNNNIPMIMEI